jgi:hypothetical protein
VLILQVVKVILDTQVQLLLDQQRVLLLVLVEQVVLAD